MTLEHYLEQEQLTEESCEQIINICAKHNIYLNDFLKTKKWNELPLRFLKEVIDSYNESSINMKTGEVVNAHISLVRFNAKGMEMVLKFLGYPNTKSKDLKHKVLVTMNDSTGKMVFATAETTPNHDVEINFHKGLNSDGNINVTIKINTENLEPNINKVNLYFFCENKDKKVKYKRLDFAIIKNGLASSVTDISTPVNINKNMIVFTIERKNNHWVTRTLCLPTTRTFDQVLRS